MVSITSIPKYIKLGEFIKSTLKKERGGATIFDGATKSLVNIPYYITRLIDGISYKKEYDWCLVVALIYLKRIREKCVKITEYNIHRFILTSILLAVKYWDDNYKFNEDTYIQLSGVRDEKELTNLQIEFLIIIEWKLFIKKIEYENMELFYLNNFTKN